MDARASSGPSPAVGHAPLFEHINSLTHISGLAYNGKANLSSTKESFQAELKRNWYLDVGSNCVPWQWRTPGELKGRDGALTVSAILSPPLLQHLQPLLVSKLKDYSLKVIGGEISELSGYEDGKFPQPEAWSSHEGPFQVSNVFNESQECRGWE